MGKKSLSDIEAELEYIGDSIYAIEQDGETNIRELKETLVYLQEKHGALEEAITALNLIESCLSDLHQKLNMEWQEVEEERGNLY